ncbi:MAG: DUF2326 domain-containing protein [Hyphomicrobium sp.]|nr:DUF2326 domain-containing protein [Hyphomicrobium sp.]
MIRKVYSSLPKFKTVALSNGANVVLADKTKDSQETDSTNGLGKSTLLRVIHFCLGSDLSRDRVLNHPDLKDVTFGIELEIGNSVARVERNTGNPESIIVDQVLLDGSNAESESLANGKSKLTLAAWKAFLTQKFYDEAATSLDGPSFRDLAAYLVRVGKDAYSEPQQSFKGQPGASKKLCASFLVGLNWKRQHSLQQSFNIRDQLRQASGALKKLDNAEGSQSVGELEAERVTVELEIRKKKEEVESFNVREDYRDLELKLGALDREIHGLLNDNHTDERLKDFYKQSSKELPEAKDGRPIEILREAGAVFSVDGLKSLEDVVSFHRDIYKNRREFLITELSRLEEEISTRGTKIGRFSDEKSEVLQVLKSSGAIDSLIALQRTYTDLVAKREGLVTLIEERRKRERQDDELTERIDRDRTVLRADLEERQASLDEARALFAEYMKILYGKPGRFSVDVGTEGYQLSFVYDRQGSDGVEQMVVFCFDLMIATMWAKKKRGFLFLAHDSTLFADVDPRQVSTALKLASEEAEKYGFSYLCCLNSGSLPRAQLEEFNLQAKIRVRLTDKTTEGRLLGILLPPVEKQKKKTRSKKQR